MGLWRMMQITQKKAWCKVLMKVQSAEAVVWCMQHEVGVRNLEILNSSTDARGRKLEVVKVHCPPPLFRTYKEAASVDVRP